MRKAARLESLTMTELYGITNNIDRCACIADHWLVADILLRARRTYDAKADSSVDVQQEMCIHWPVIFPHVDAAEDNDGE